jgi:hypothetical protein
MKVLIRILGSLAEQIIKGVVSAFISILVLAIILLGCYLDKLYDDKMKTRDIAKPITSSASVLSAPAQKIEGHENIK